MKEIYTCPMHPEVQRDRPGDCHICGMRLEPTIANLDLEQAEYAAMRNRFWLSVLLALPVVLLAASNMFGTLLPLPISEQHSLLIQLICTTLLLLFPAAPIFKKAWDSLLHRSPNMFTLFALGIGCAYVYSAFAFLFPGLLPASFKENGKLFIYFEAAAVISVLVLLGQTLEYKARTHTGRAIKNLLLRGASSAILLSNGTEQEVPVDQVKVGDLLRVKPGAKVPVDGVILEGSSFVDESMISGESIPVEKKVSDLVIGSTLNQSGSFLMQAKRVGSETMLAQIVQMVTEAERSKAPVQKFADQVASYFVPAVILIALLTFIAWFFLGPQPRFVYALLNAVAVLIIACPCALGLATPMSIMAAVGRGAEMGVLFKNAESLEQLAKAEVMLLDKTGTITQGQPKVTSITPAGNRKDAELLKAVAAVEQASEHPLSKAIVHAAEERGLSIPEVAQFNSFPGKGTQGHVEGHQLLVGSRKFLLENGVKIELAVQPPGKSIVYAAIDHLFAGSIQIEDPLKPSSQEAIAQLHQQGLQVLMVTGDHQQTAQALAKQLQTDQVIAEVDPAEKKQAVEKEKAKGKIVAMAGDGVNDAPALAAADVGIAMGTGTDVAIESAGVTLVHSDLKGLVSAIRLSRACMKNIKQNLFFAFIYNVLGIPIAAGILYPFFGLLLNPMIAGAAMSLSSVSVILNSLRLNKTVL